MKTNYKKKKEDLAKSSSKMRAGCEYCGNVHPWGRTHCPAYSAECFRCGKLGHFASRCYGRRSHTSGKGTSDGTIGTVVVGGPGSRRRTREEMKSVPKKLDRNVVSVGAASCMQPIVNVTVSCAEDNKSCVGSCS